MTKTDILDELIAEARRLQDSSKSYQGLISDDWCRYICQLKDVSAELADALEGLRAENALKDRIAAAVESEAYKDETIQIANRERDEARAERDQLRQVELADRATALGVALMMERLQSAEAERDQLRDEQIRDCKLFHALEDRLKFAEAVCEMVDYQGVYKDCPALYEALARWREGK